MAAAQVRLGERSRRWTTGQNGSMARYLWREEVDAAAQLLADSLSGKIRDDSAVVIIRDAEGELIDGIYPNNVGRFWRQRRAYMREMCRVSLRPKQMTREASD